MTKDIRLLEQTLTDNLPWNKARIKFVTRFLLALYAVRTVNLTKLATAFAGRASEEAHYKRLQRFLHSFAVPTSGFMVLRLCPGRDAPSKVRFNIQFSPR